jgi:hypothetical protein
MAEIVPADRTVVMGVDLSQTGLGLDAVPGDWDLHWDRIAHVTVGRKLAKGAPPWEAAERLECLVSEAIRFARVHAVTHVFIEGYPKSGRVFHLDMEAELGGALKLALRRDLELTAHTSELSTARKLVMGKLPRADVKRLVHGTVRSFDRMLLSWTGDEIDAWVAANLGMSKLGLCAVAAPQVTA